MTATHLFLDGVAKTFGQRRALVTTTLLAQGGVTTVVGANGCGKSTLLRCAATVTRPDAGTVTIDGLDPRRETERIEARRRIGYAPQEAGFDGRMRVFDAVDVIAVLKGHDDERRRRRDVFGVLDEVGLVERAHDRVRDLSGGMRRRLVLAQTLLGTPSLIVLDEPTVGLDPEERLRWHDSIDRRRAAATVVTSTHLLDEAETADTVLVLDDGEACFLGSSQQLTATAADRVWECDGLPPPGASGVRTLPDGRVRYLGVASPGSVAATPTLEDGYLLVRRRNV